MEVTYQQTGDEDIKVGHDWIEVKVKEKVGTLTN